MQKLVGHIWVLFSGESKSAIKNGSSYLSFLSSPHPHPQGVAVGGRVWYHWMSPFETNNFHYPLCFIQCIVLEIFQCLQINRPPCIYILAVLPGVARVWVLLCN